MNGRAMIDVRPLNSRDRETADAILRVLLAGYAIEAESIGATTFPPLEETVDGILARTTEFHGVRVDGALSAVIELERGEPSETTLIAALVVHPDRFRRGLGRALVEFAIEEAAGPIRVSTASRNRPAIALYRSLGFRAVGDRRTLQGIEVESFLHPGR